MTTLFRPAERLKLAAYPFAELERKASAIKKSGQPLFDLSIGDPDLPPPEFLVKAIKDAMDLPESHLYPSSQGHPEVRKSVARWFKGRFDVNLDSDTQVCLLVGAKEGLAHIATALVNPGDAVIIPELSYPVYGRAGCQLVHGYPVPIPLEAKKGFLPDLHTLPQAKLMYLNYPNNPTGAVAPEGFMRELGFYADSHPEMTVVYDMAYSEVSFGETSRSLLEFTDNAVEFHSLSKMANATGFRIGFAVGDPERISALTRVKQELDSGAPLPFQMGLKAVLDAYVDDTPPAEISSSLNKYHTRKQLLKASLTELGFEVYNSDATFYVWFKVGGDELKFVDAALAQGILFTPGRGFGNGGRGWVRASVTATDEVIEETVNRLKAIKF